MSSTVVPNVFDFDHPRPTPRHDIRREIRAELGMADGGLLIVQPTRVIPRKGIELTIELASRLEDPGAVVLITSPAGDEGLDYLIGLERQAERSGVNLRYAADRFEPDLEGRPINPAHSLTEAYLAADLIAYPSLYEGFGNALIEAVFFGKPVFVNRYPVYDADIRPLGFRFAEIAGTVTDEAVDGVRSLLADPARMAEDAEHNFAIGKAHLGYDRLERRSGAAPRLRAGVAGGSVAGLTPHQPSPLRLRGWRPGPRTSPSAAHGRLRRRRRPPRRLQGPAERLLGPGAFPWRLSSVKSSGRGRGARWPPRPGPPRAPPGPPIARRQPAGR